MSDTKTLKDIIVITENEDKTRLTATIHIGVTVNLDKESLAFEGIREEVIKSAQYSIGKCVLQHTINELLSQNGYAIDFYGEKAQIKVSPFVPIGKPLIMMHPETYIQMLSKNNVFSILIREEKPR